MAEPDARSGAQPQPRPAEAPREDPFAVLAVPPSAGDAGVRDAYRAALREHPPERDPEGFKRIRWAYESLRGPSARARAAVLLHPWIEGCEAPSAEELGAVRPDPPEEAFMLAELRRPVAEGTDFGRTAFPEDLRQPPPPPWAG